MDFDSQQERLLEDVVKLAAARKRAFKPVTVLIDGPSGAGKTWTSAALAERTNWRVVHLDEFYPGWHGLDKGSDMVAEQVLRTMNPGYWRWDWEADSPGDWASLDVRDDLIVEGVGSVTAANIAAAKDLPLVLVVNDNERSYAPTIGGMAHHLATMRTMHTYDQVLDWGKNRLQATPKVGTKMYEALHGVKRGLKDIVYPDTGVFESLGIKYLGPIDGHDEAAVEAALRRARDYGRPTLVHVITQKGRGYEPAFSDEADQWHGIGKFNPETGLPFEVSGRIWTDEFSDEMVRLGAERDDIVAITAAMLIPVGLDQFAEKYPERVFDVGIAEQHAATMAAGLSYAGLHPVVAIYATFLNRAFDQLLMDCAMHKAGVTFVLDRSGVTGPDGASHHGMWDMSLASIVPGLRLAAPRDGQQIRVALREAVDVEDGPTVIRFPKGSVADPLEAVATVGGLDVLAGDPAVDPEVLVVSVGSMAGTATTVAEKLAAEGHSTLVVDPRWVLPVPAALVELAARSGRVAVIEASTSGYSTSARMR